MNEPLTTEQRVELRNAKRAHVNAERGFRAANEKLRLAVRRVCLAEAAMHSPAYKAAQQAYHADADGDMEGYDGA